MKLESSISIASTSYSDSNISTGTTYSYEVSAVDSTGNESPKSNKIALTPLSKRMKY